jgi:probable HAF family extracellular repeat protein
MNTLRFSCAVFLAAFASSATCADATFLGLGNLSSDATPPGSYAFGVSADGSVVVGTSYFIDTEGNETRAFRWTAKGGMENLGVPPDTLSSSMAMRVSNDGKVVAGAIGFAIEAYYEIRNAAFWDLNKRGSGVYSGVGLVASDVTANGNTLVGATRVPGPWPIVDKAFKWSTSAGGPVTLGLLPGGSYSAAAAVSADGSVVVGYGDTPSQLTAFRWTHSTGMVPLAGQPEGMAAQASGITPDGSIIVGFLNDEACRWTESEHFVLLGKLPGSGFARALDVNADGTVVVGTALYDEFEAAFVWDPIGGMRNLAKVLATAGVDLGGWSLSWATGVSDDGRTIVGHGINPGGLSEGFVVHLPLFGDLDDDGVVDGADLGLLLAGWGDCKDGAACADLNIDGIVDGADLGLMLAAWS